MEVLAQAKVNLRLRVLAREANGYHQLETLFLRLALADTVRVRRTSGARALDVSGDVALASIGPVEKNLAWRAADAFASAAGMSGGFEIEIDKRIPIGGGLGGGSADAGAVLRAMQTLADEPLADDVLLAIAASLGADVPFMATDAAYALAWGRGERMLALEPPPARDVWLLVPDFSVNTAEAYGWLADARAAQTARAHDAILLDVGALSGWETIAAHAVNDFEPVVAERHPEVVRLLEVLREAGAEVAMMSGSGSTVFGVAGASVHPETVRTDLRSNRDGERDGRGNVEAGGGPPVADASALAVSIARAGARLIETRSATHVEPILAIE